MNRFAVAFGFWLVPLMTMAQDETTLQGAKAVPVVETELSAERVAVGQPVVLSVSVLVPTWLPEPPVFPSVDLPNVIVRLPERASGPISERIDGETWSGVRRSYRLYPMIPGPVSLPPQSVTITYADPETTQPVIVEAELAATTFTATVPEGAEGLDPLVLGAGLTLEQSFEGGEGTLSAGDAVTRQVTATIKGTSALFLPPLLPTITGDAVRAHPKDPVVQETEDRGTLSGTRTETTTYIAQYGGVVELPEIALDWFNVETGQVETASLAGLTLEVDAPAAPTEAKVDRRQIVTLIGAVVLLVLLIWVVFRFVLPPLRQWRGRRQAAWRDSEGYAAREVERAIAAKDLGGVHSGIAAWSLRCPGDEGADLQTALAGLGADRFGKGTEPAVADGWSTLASAFSAERAARRSKLPVGNAVLPPLNPS